MRAAAHALSQQAIALAFSARLGHGPVALCCHCKVMLGLIVVFGLWVK